MSSAPDHVYLDLFTVNGDNNGSGIKTNLYFNETRSTNILDNPSNYFLSIVRFECDTPAVTLPLFMPVMCIDGVNTDPRKTAYTVTLAIPDQTNKLLTKVKTANVYWSPEDQSATLPNNKLNSTGAYITSQDFSTGYYNCYSTRWWLSCVNNALVGLWNQYATVPGVLSNAAFAPFLTIDAISNNITLFTPYLDTTGGGSVNVNFAQQSWAATSPVANLAGGFYPTYLGLTNYIGLTPPTPVVFSLFFNEPMANLFSSFTSVYYGNTIQAAAFANDGSIATINNEYWRFNYYIMPINYQNLNLNLNFINTVGDYSPVPMWNPISSMIFTSSLLPVSMSMTTVPNVYNSSPYDTTYSGSGNNAATTNMLSDIQIGLTTGTEYKPSVLYVPGGEYRLIDMLGSNPINQASFGVAFKTKYGQVIPFKLGSQCGANIKILFRRKRWNLGQIPPYDTN
jgi:hypothetical protein